MKLLRVSGKNGSVGAFKLVLVGLMVLTLVVSLPASQKKRGNDLVITTVDNRVFRAELLTIKGNDLIMIGGNPSSEIVINIDEVSKVQVVKKSKAGVGLIVGAAAGGVLIALVAHDVNQADCPLYEFFGKMALAGAGLSFVILSGGGALVGALVGTDRHLNRVRRTPEENARILAKLNQYARVPRSYQVPAKVTE